MNRSRRFTDADQLATAMAQAATRVGPATAAAVRHEAMVLQALIQAAASGRPGPNTITGRYRASWQVQVHTRRHGAEATVGTFAPQARRLELGFYGADSLGRVYAQPPLPHVAPALATLQPGYPGRVATAAMGAFR
ncbi:HK97 gp10 family phage protein [Streptomyces sp. bgisy060]|uniref:HK97 gp10 family phage protein n=1 Tax=Streptomyces sp. bgisy060 TaxID=3413775 RepID=UPI003EBADFB6